MRILLGEPWMPFVIHIKWWRWDIITSSPLENLFLSMLSSGLCLVKTLESSVMTLIKSPVFMMRDP
jgi:hypothetical protein